MRAGRGLLVGVMSLLCGIDGCAVEIPRDQMDQVWEDLMLIGKGAWYWEGKRREEDIQLTGTEKSRGTSSWAARHISVQDFRGTGPFGVLWGGGWDLDGGLLGEVEGKTARIELYVKNVHKYHPGLFDNYWFSKEETNEYFLLLRAPGTPRASVLKKWIIRAEEMKWFVPEFLRNESEQLRRQNERTDVRGFLKYVPASQEAEVTVTGLVHPFVERVKVSLQ